MKKKNRTQKEQFKRLHNYYSYTGFYSFVGRSLKKAIVPILITVAALFIVDRFLLDFSDFFSHITENYPPAPILTAFFISESVLGLVPPEIFIAWSSETAAPVVYLAILALLSYAGGIVSFWAGRMIFTIPSVYKKFEGKLKKHLTNIRKWGGFLIVVGALLPIPFAMASLAAGTINYKFKNYLFFGLLRFVRFAIYGVAIFSIM